MLYITSSWLIDFTTGSLHLPILPILMTGITSDLVIPVRNLELFQTISTVYNQALHILSPKILPNPSLIHFISLLPL